MIELAQILLGAVLALGFILLVRQVARDRELLVYAIGLVVAALVYVLFAAVGGDGRDLLIELGGVAVFGFFAAAGYWHSPMWVAVGWAGHVGWDVLLHPAGAGTYAPGWYVLLCIGFDLLVAGYIVARRYRWVV